MAQAVSQRGPAPAGPEADGPQTDIVAKEEDGSAVTVDAQAPSPSRCKPRWDDAPLRVKVALLVTLAALGGCFVGMAEAHAHHTVWPMSLGLTLVVGALVWLASAWVYDPFDRLLVRLDRVLRFGRPVLLQGLPVWRKDEVGRIARAVHELTLHAIRDHHQASQLRRTLDARVAEATSRAVRQLRQIAMRDPLTELGNRRFLDEQLQPLIDCCRNSNTDVVCAAIDLDNFKQVNDKLGHATGDDLLVFLAQLLRGSLRQDDYAVRVGGDEFVVLMPGCTLSKAHKIMGQIQALFRQQVRGTMPEHVRPDVSIGLASLLAEKLSVGTELMQRADEHLYAAKNAGKAQIHGA